MVGRQLSRETVGVPIPGNVPGEVRGSPKQPDLVQSPVAGGLELDDL